ncbi:MAG: hypothetical protein ACFE8E_02870 [Candidatus Hodarchaeota archaeon]
MAHDFNQLQSKKIECAICRADIKSLKDTYQSYEFHSIVCKECIKKFPSGDIDMMISLFYIYGGYYGQKKDTPFIIEDLLPLIVDDLSKQGCSIKENIEEFSKKSFHQALLHGISPEEYIKSLRSLLE